MAGEGGTDLSRGHLQINTTHGAGGLFNHSPLDQSKLSIRLLLVHSRRSEFGLVQCELLHATVDDSYTCLSYVWGSPDTKRLILVNGKLFKVRENLYNFLCAAQKVNGHLPSTWYWIDALCIDQSNTVERNHQVAQMGTIYSRAQTVSIWLGSDKPTSRLLNVALEAWELMGRLDTFAQFREASKGANFCNIQVATDWAKFTTHVYWTRAWITQEVLLARKIHVSTDAVSLRGEQLRPICYLKDQLTDCFPMTRLFGDTAVLGARSMKYLEEMFSPRQREERTIMQLLNDFPGRNCEVARDQIHSLAFLASDGPQVLVDYAMHDRDFLYSLMNGLRASITCMCSVTILANTLGHSVKAGEKGSLGLCFVVIMETSQSGGVPLDQRTSRRRLFASLSAKPFASSTYCSNCGTFIRNKNCKYVCLKTHCSSMSGHLVGIPKSRRHLDTGVRSLALDLGDKELFPVTSRAVKVQQARPDAISIFLYADELIYLVQTASTPNDTYSSSGICSRTPVDGAILKVL